MAKTLYGNCENLSKIWERAVNSNIEEDIWKNIVVDAWSSGKIISFLPILPLGKSRIKFGLAVAGFMGASRTVR